MGKGKWRLITTGGLKKGGKNGPCVFLLIKYLDQSGFDFMLELRNFRTFSLKKHGENIALQRYEINDYPKL
jgi:hypothetical protein